MQRHYRLFGERFRYPALPPPNRVGTAAEIFTDTGRFDEVMKRCLNGDKKGAFESRQNAVRAAERASHPRLASYQAKLTKPCS